MRSRKELISETMKENKFNFVKLLIVHFNRASSERRNGSAKIALYHSTKTGNWCMIPCWCSMNIRQVPDPGFFSDAFCFQYFSARGGIFNNLDKVDKYVIGYLVIMT